MHFGGCTPLTEEGLRYGPKRLKVTVTLLL